MNRASTKTTRHPTPPAPSSPGIPPQWRQPVQWYGATLLAWFDGRTKPDGASIYPWRAEQGARIDPYRVWVSEIMLQQTRADIVIRYYTGFITRFPDILTLAAAQTQEVLQQWSGLGYYARARNMHRAAQQLVAQNLHELPRCRKKLQELPGIGAYVSAAIMAIAYDEPAAPVDGNIERIICRLAGIPGPVRIIRQKWEKHVAQLLPTARIGDFVQALMDLGRSHCHPRCPACTSCPISDGCTGHQTGVAAQLGRRSKTPPRPQRYGVAFLIRRHDGAAQLRHRPYSGLLGGMLEIPGTPWRDQPWGDDDETRHLLPSMDPHGWQKIPGTVRHVFTHFTLTMTIWTMYLTVKESTAQPSSSDTPPVWWQPDDGVNHAMPSLTRKLLHHANGFRSNESEIRVC